ncbi:dedicator of cytokinesis protein 1-like isoform X3 [Biomphalaria glabrata]|uniref:Dedicator of cytokinesis protein 1-like isoform X3 n=1 Tax=Biomphalaria glabrata TaxID=6526 RepID=A0A9W3BKG7_BIOGL|nr:dedicator of cytokinesis protein 1-like isoform X3 [Biomphalaria glabrata]
MKIWKKTDSRAKLGVAIYNFHDDGEHRLALDIGDTVQILEETDDWFRGFAIKNKTKKGIFPRNYIFLKEASVFVSGAQETVTSKEHPLVIELTNVLREWHAIWKQMFVERNEQLDHVQEMIMDLVDWRNKILARIFTVDELREVQQKVTSLIDQGNALLKLDLVVRDDQGNILNPEQSSIIEIYRRHVEAAERIHKETNKRDSDIETRPNWPSSFNLFVMLRNFVCKIGEDSDIMMNLFDAKEEKFISENYLVKWGKQGVPKDLDMINNFRVVFTDLGSKDRMRDKVFLVFQVVRIGVMDPKYVDNKKQTQGVRRPFGVAAMDISNFMQGTKVSPEDSQYFVPFQHCNDDCMFNIIKKVITAKDINHRGQGFWVSLKVLHGDMKQVKENYPHLVQPGTAIARKMGFPDVIMPGDVRNDIYLTVMNGEFTKGPTKSTDKNVEVTMTVCDGRGDVMQNVISHGCIEMMMSEFRSMVYYHQDKPKWFETIKVAISTDVEFSGLHLKFLFRHKSSTEAKDRSEKPFAMSFVRLLNDNGTTLEDQIHELLVYKIETKKYDDAALYLKLPCSRQELESFPAASNHKQSGGLALSHRDSFFVYSYVCSTKLTHNVDLLGLLKWHEVLNDTKALKTYLEHLMKEEGEEIVKFLQDLLDSLFNILMQHTNNELCDNLVFDALVYIIGLISDRKYSQFRPVLDAYITSTFSFAMAYNKLMVILKDYVDKANDKTPQSENSLLPAVKSLEYIFKFIIRSRQLFSLLNEGRGKQQFEISLRQLITAINNMMIYKTDNTLLVQGAALKYMSCVIGDVITVFDKIELSHLLVQFINNVPLERLTKQKMKCIDQIILSDLFIEPACRQVLLPSFLQHTHALMEHNDEMEECISILSHIMDRLWSYEGSRDVDTSIMVEKILRTVIQAVIGMDQSSKHTQFFGHQPPPSVSISFETINGNCVCVMISLLRQMTDSHYRAYIKSFPTHFDLMDFLMEILCVFRDLVHRNVYPQDWLEMIMVQNSVILRALRIFAATIHENFSSPFEQQLWNNFFHCAIAFLTQDSLQLDNFSASKRNKIISRYKDMRRETGFEIRAMWFKLGPNKIKFIPQLVGPILEMTLIPEVELRKATIPIFFDMMNHEFVQPIPNSNAIQENFNEFENEIITKLDTLIEGGRGDEQYKDLFTEIMYHLCENNQILYDQGCAFVGMIHDLLERLLVYRTIIQDEVREHRMSCIVNLLDFYHEINRQEMYIRYLHKLCDLHLGCDNFTEAAYTLLLYTRLLQWSDEALAPMLQNNKFPDAMTNRELKEKLYYETISYFDKGKMWEKGIELCEELCLLYRDELFDYVSLGKILRRQAELYDCIMRQIRPEPEYFRVGYFGLGFPSFIQNKVFIYRGKEYERLADFNARMQNLFPNAELMKTLDTPDSEILESSKQYLQINAVTPVMNLKERLQNRNISEQILKYYRVNEVQQFTFTRRKEEGSSDVTNMWLERTFIKTSYPLPGIVGWFPVIDIETVLVSPIENAIETIEEKNKQLIMLIEQHRMDSTLRVDPLGMQLNGVVDPAVNGGIASYKEFYIGDFDRSLQDRLKEVTIEQITILRDGLMVHKAKAPDSLQPFHTHMEQRFSQMCNLIEKEYGIKVADKGFLSATLRRNQSLPSTSSNRMSDLSVSSLNVNNDWIKYRAQRTLTSNMNTPRNPSTRSQSVWVKDKTNSVASAPKASPSSKVSLSTTLKKRVSQVTEQFTDSSHRNSVDSPIELSEQLTPKRPLRPETERRPSRPPSAQLSNSHAHSGSTNSLSSTHSRLSGDQGDLVAAVNAYAVTTMQEPANDVPPPLPEKQSASDYLNQAGEIVRRPSSISQHSNSRHKPPPPPPPVLEVSEDTPPPVPPKPTQH